MGTHPHLDSVSARVTLYSDTPYDYAAAAAGLVWTHGWPGQLFEIEAIARA